MIWKQLWKRFRLLKQLAKVFALLSLLFLNGMNINTDQLRKLKCWVKFQEAISPKTRYYNRNICAADYGNKTNNKYTASSIYPKQIAYQNKSLFYETPRRINRSSLYG